MFTWDDYVKEPKKNKKKTCNSKRFTWCIDIIQDNIETYNTIDQNIPFLMNDLLTKKSTWDIKLLIKKWITRSL